MSELEPISNGLVQVTANSRLHFGLINCGKLARTPSSSRNVGLTNPGRLFGGIGAMIRNPDLLIQIQPAPRLEIFGDLPHRAHEFVERWFRHFRGMLEFNELAETPCRILLSSPQDHTGLGTGTQIGLSIGTALCEYFGLQVESPQAIASIMKRGKRSAIGVHGFQTGGFLFDGGKVQKNAGCTIGELKKQLPLPPEWRVVMATRETHSGMTGQPEFDAFQKCPVGDIQRESKLLDLVESAILPAIEQEDFAAFSKAIGEYGYESGLYFTETQGGPYNGPDATALVEGIRERGFAGVGQSSWGPTIYTLAKDSSSAQSLAEWINENENDYVARVSEFANEGAKIEVLEQQSI